MLRNVRARTAICVAMIAFGTMNAEFAEAQQAVARLQCEGSYLGVQLQGYLIIERWLTTRSFRYYGRFADPSNNLIELEVFSASTHGTGSAWANGMRHRETHLSLALHQRGFTTKTEDGVVSQFSCKTGRQ